MSLSHNLCPKTWAYCLRDCISDQDVKFFAGSRYRFTRKKFITEKHRKKIRVRVLKFSTSETYTTFKYDAFVLSFRPIITYASFSIPEIRVMINQHLLSGMNTWWALRSWNPARQWCFEMLILLNLLDKKIKMPGKNTGESWGNVASKLFNIGIRYI